MKKQDQSPAKITKPRIAGIVQRERLFILLDAGRAKQMVWISGPAGAGKTTLAASYIDSRKLSCLWFQMDEGDNDVASFFYHLGLAVRTAAPRHKKNLPLLTPEYLAGVATFAKRYFETVYARMKTPFLLVFDNYQEVAPVSLVHEAILQGAALAPEGVTVVIISRTEPLPAFSRLIANAMLSTLTAGDLRFTEQESREFFALRARRNMLPDSAAELHERTRGWAAGLVLFTERAGRADHGPEPPGSHLPAELFPYFAGELFDITDRETQQFLLKTAVFAGFTASLANSISGTHNAERVLSELTRKNYFILKQTEPDPLYQYHPLFRDFLLARGGEHYPPGELAKLRESAASLLEQSGRIDDAVDLFLQAGNWTQAARLILQGAPALLSQGRFMTLLGWINELPEAMLQASGYLLYFSGACLMPVQPAESRKKLELAYEQFRIAGDRAGMFLALSGLIDLIAFESEDYSALDVAIDRLRTLFDADPRFPSGDIEIRVTLSMFNALSLRRPGNPETIHWEERAYQAMRLIPDRNLRINACLYLTVYNLWMGRTVRASVVVDVIRGDAEANDVTPAAALAARTTIALYEWMAGACDASLEAMRAGLALAEESGIRLWSIHLLEHGTAAALSKGDVKTADELLGRIRADLGQARRLDYGYYIYLELWRSLLKRDAARAREYLQRSSELSSSLGLPYGDGLLSNIAAMVLFESGLDNEAEQYNDACLSLGLQIDNKLLEYMALLFKAYMYFKKADAGNNHDRPESGGKGREALQRAFTVGREQGIMNMNAWRPDIMAGLCVKALEMNIEPEYVRKLVRTRNLIPLTPPDAPEAWPWKFELRTLGGFKLQMNGEPLSFAGKAQKKPLEMIKAMVVLGGESVDERRLSEMLWPEAEGDLARKSFDTTLYRLRKLLGDDKAITMEDGKLTFNPALWRIDVMSFELQFNRIQDLARTGDAARPADSALPQIDSAVRLYAGAFLPDDADLPWTVSLRTRLQSKFLRLIVLAGTYSEDAGAWERAKEYYQKGLDVDGLVEEFYQHLMLCCHKLGQRAEAASIYLRCRDVLSAAIGVPPSPKTLQMYSSLFKER